MADLWLIDLIGEFTTTKGPPAADKIRRLSATYASEAPAVMQLAANDYMRDGGRFFPRVGELARYVDHARELFTVAWAGRRDVLAPAEYEQIDQALYALEVGGGTIDPAASAEADLEARRIFPALLAKHKATIEERKRIDRDIAFSETAQKTAVFEL